MDKVRIRLLLVNRIAEFKEARTALFNWLFAQAYNGTLVFRSEDIDQERSSVEAEGLFKPIWPGWELVGMRSRQRPYGPYRQTERRDVCSFY